MPSPDPAGPIDPAGPGSLCIFPVVGMGEVRAGDDLAALLAERLLVTAGAGRARPAVPGGLADGDVVVVTQKVVSKAEGRVVAVDHDDPGAKVALVESESVRIVRRRGDLLITETRHGFICANAGVDLSNVEAGTAALLPLDPDRSADRDIGAALALGADAGVEEVREQVPEIARLVVAEEQVLRLLRARGID